MSVDQETVAKIASLARIRVDEDQQVALAGELSNILEWIELLNELETEGVRPLTSVVEMTAPQRDDVVTDGDRVDDIIANAPDPANSFFAVPKVVE